MDSLMCPKGYASVGQPYIEFRIANEARGVDNQILKGKVVLINFWFEGCHPCMAEMDALNNLFKKMNSQVTIENGLRIPPNFTLRKKRYAANIPLNQ